MSSSKRPPFTVQCKDDWSCFFCFPSTKKTNIASKAENIFLRGKGLAMLFKKGPFTQPFSRPLSAEHSQLEDLEIKSEKRREFNVSNEVSGFRLI